MDLSLMFKAKIALQAAAAKAERVLTEIKADLKAELSRPLSPLTPNYGGLFKGSDGGGDLPWIGKTDLEKRHEAELRLRILEIAERPEEHLLKVYDDAVDVRADMQSAGAILEYDENLRNLRFQYVPKRMKEQEFWRRYFIAVRNIKQEFLEIESETGSDVTLSNAEHKSSQGASDAEAESPRKDPLEEEAYRKAFSVAAIPPSMIVRRLAAAIEVGKTVKSMQELATLGRTDKDSSQSGDWSSFMRKLSSREKESKTKSLEGIPGEYNSLLWSLFEADTQYEEKTDNSDGLHIRSKLPEEIHGAPPESFVAQLAEIMAGIKSEQKMAEFWLEVVKELRRRWNEGLPISRMPVDQNPNLQYCLLHQQLQLVNCCIARCQRRAEALDALDALNDSQAAMEFSVPSDKTSYVETEPADQRKSISPPPAPALYAKLKTGQLVLRLGTDKPARDLRLLETKELVYSPITQEAPVLTEDLLRETEELVLRTRSVGAGCSQLFSDMQAFQAANPGCILEDFVRWYSPLDWREEPGSGLCMHNQDAEERTEEVAVRGYLSARMQSEGNLWQELWASARPVPAVKQAPLFDEELAGESTLNGLDDVAPSDLFEQLFTAALSAGFAIAEASPVAKKEPLSRYLKHCTEYVMSTCGRGMSSVKLEHLCEAYEVMQTAMHLPPEEMVDWTGPSDGSGGCSPVPEYLSDSPKSELRRQMLKGESGNIFTRLFDGKSSLFDKIPSRRSSIEEDKRPSPPEGDWTMV